MIVSSKLGEVRQTRWDNPSLEWGLVPTMGYLHEGHLSLVRRARDENDRVAVSIYVNPTQFAPSEDLATYPRDVKRDLALLLKEHVDLVFMPDDALLYPPGFQTWVTVEKISRFLEGAARPSHFQGVATIVVKLFNIFEPRRTYFGQKDAQQAAVIRQMVRDLNFNLDVVICPIVREADGLAMSSRNVRLSASQRQASVILYQALQKSYLKLKAGERNGDTLRKYLAGEVNKNPLARLDYASVADPLTLEELQTVTDGVLFSLAVFFGQVRLIDNMLVEAIPDSEPKK